MSIQEFIASHKDSLGIHEYAFLSTSDLVFSQDVRHLCEFLRTIRNYLGLPAGSRNFGRM